MPNYSLYDYTECIQNFNESDRLLETKLNMLVCYQDFQLEASLNSFSEGTLNGHLYTIYQRKRLDSVSTMHKLVSFFICHYKSQLEPRVKEYLDSKKLTLDQCLESVKNNHCGDILCICKAQPCRALLGYPFCNTAAHMEATPTREGI